VNDANDLPTDTVVAAQAEAIDRILNPRSVAVVGASPRPGSYGGRFLRSLLYSSDRVAVYPVNPRHEEIDGRRCYPSVLALPEVPDLVGVAVRQDKVLSVLRESRNRGSRAAVVISAGFAERGEDQRKGRQAEIASFAQASGIRICGPNCLGVANLRRDVWACASLDTTPSIKPRAGKVAVISQSGAVGFGTIAPRAAELGVGLSHLITTGNEADLEFSDFASYLLDDEDTKVIAGFVEGFKDVPKFVELCKRAASVAKPIVLIKVGRSYAGAQVARSHTAALTGSDETFEMLFKQYGVVRVRDFDELLSVANLFATNSRPGARGVALVSHSGGINSVTADLLADAAVELPSLSEEARAGISNVLGSFGWASNPADVTQFAWRDQIRDVIRYMMAEPSVGTLIMASLASETQMAALTAERSMSDKAMVYLWTGSRNGGGPADQADNLLVRLTGARIPVFFGPAELAEALRQFYRYYDWLSQQQNKIPSVLLPLSSEQCETLRRLGAAGRMNLTEGESSQLIRACGVAVATTIEARSATGAVEAAAAIGYPVAVKVTSAAIAHKSDADLVHLDVSSAAGVRTAYKAIVAKAAALTDARPIRVVVQEMIKGGLELMIGVHHDSQAGPVLLCGAGGVHVEIHRDVSMRLCPIGPDDAREMLTELRVARLLGGYRGRPALDVTAVVDALVAISKFAASAADRIQELEVNPLIVLPEGKGVRAVDALVTLRSQG
jgi:acyl-CoA synthetase (NDP forming)